MLVSGIVNVLLGIRRAVSSLNSCGLHKTNALPASPASVNPAMLKSETSCLQTSVIPVINLSAAPTQTHFLPDLAAVSHGSVWGRSFQSFQKKKKKKDSSKCLFFFHPFLLWL